MNTQQPSRPVITPAMREQAVKQPNTWLYVVDPIFTDPSAEVPPWGFIGGYRVDEHGEITDDFSPNPNYRPSPVALRLPAPTNDVERALQLTTTGYAQGQALLAALLEAELVLFAQPQGSGLFVMDHESGRKQLQVFTSDGFLPPNWTTWQRMTGRALAGLNLAGTDVQINPTSPVKARLPGEDLVKAAASIPPKAPPPSSPATGVPVVRQPEPAPEPAPAPEEPARPGAPSPADTELGRRFTGALLAAAIGDALGAPVEFYPVDQIRGRHGANGVTEYDRGHEHPGEFTDDTQLLAFTVEGLIRGHRAVRDGSPSPLPAVQHAYQRWLHTQGYGWSRVAGPFAETNPEPTGWLIGERELFAVRSPNSTCITALREFAAVGAPGTLERPINESPDNSGVVRAAPVALWSDDPGEVFELAAAIAALTSSAPNAYLPAGAQAVLVRGLLRGDAPPEALAETRQVLRRYRDHEDTDLALARAEELAAEGKPSPERLKDALGGGWAGHEALAIAVCAVLSTDNVAAAVMLAVNHSGDSDSTGAICGALAGALHGVSALPGVWLRDLGQRELIEALAADALREFGPNPPADEAWARRYPAEQDRSEIDFTSTPPLASAEAAPPEPAEADVTAAITVEPTDPAEDPAPAETAEPAPVEPEPAEPEPEPVEPEPVDEAPAAEALAGEPIGEDQLDPARVRARRVHGFLLGGAVGDALGYPIEDDDLAAIRRKHGPDGLADFVDAARPGGSISDDTQMTLFTLEGLIRASIRRRRFGEHEPGTQVQHAYQRWLHTQGFDWRDAGGPLATTPPDGWLIRCKGLFVRRAPGKTCIQALHGYATGTPRGSFTHRLNDSKSCGGVMRAAPAGLWSDDPATVFQVGSLTAVLTHGHPSGYLPAGALAVIIQQLVADRSLPEAVDRALGELSSWDGHEETTAALRAAVDLATSGAPTPEELHERLGEGWFGEQALGIAVCAALARPDSFADAVLLAANHSGDSDSSAAICGNIMGAALMPEAIPQPWRDGLELREVIEELARDAVEEFGPNPPTTPEWWERYPVGEAEPEQPEPVPEPAAVAETAAVPEPAPAPAAVPEAAEPEPAPAEADARPVPADVADDPDEGLSDEEVRLLAAWRKFRDGEEGTSAELSQGLNKLLVEAFGEDRAAQLLGEAAADEVQGAGLPAEEQVQPDRQERFTGCVLGAAVGDALGGPWMFSDLRAVLRANPEGVREYAEFFGRRGTATSLSQQGAFVLEAMIRAVLRTALRGVPAHHPSMVLTSLQHWLHTQGVPAEPARRAPLAERDVLRAQRFPDETTLSALARWADRRDAPTPANPPNAARTVAATVRGPVLGFAAADPAQAIGFGAEMAVVTHGHPDGYLPAGALAGLIAALDDGRTLAESVRTVLAELDQLEGASTTAEGLRSALERAASGPLSPTALEELGLGWTAPEALAIAVAAALSHPNSFLDAVSLAATHSGNSAATAAICGALLGAARGAGDIPAELSAGLELRPVLDELVADLLRARTEVITDREPPEWAGRYLG
ncbi:type VII secretion system-associated protein [Saccharopolyspora sp. CA-218241]|uniref:type VII secretion system-associated protein n=1 Tax=Saccharopolyspora sp. CA-218241 TaxID=3240027 RepID=UPI003D9629E1